MSVVRTRARLSVGAMAVAVATTGLSLVNAPAATAAPPTIDCPPPAQDPECAANGQTVTQIPTLRWVRQAEATKYDVQLSTSNTFTTKLVDVQTVNSQYTPIVQLPAGDLFWRVRITGSGDTGWAYADFKRGTLPVPSMLGPTGLLPQPSSPPLVSWTPVQGAQDYYLQISSDPDFIDPTKIVSFNPTKTTTGISPVLSVPGAYSARVRASLGGNIFTGWSAPTTFTIQGLAAATKISPPDSGTVTDAVVDWQPVPGAATYQVQMDDDINFGSPAVDVDGITGTRFAPPKTVGNDSYYWRVRPVDAAGNARAWTVEDRSVLQRSWPGQVHLEYPANTATVGNPFYYQWSPSERASSAQEDRALSSSYTLEVSTSSSFPVAGTMRCNTVNTTWVPGSSLNGGQQCWPTAAGTYYWRVIGHDDFSTSRPQTEPAGAEVRTFTYAPAYPTPLSPVGGAHVTIPTVSWSPVAGAARYRVTITSNLGASLTATTASTSYTPDATLDAGSYTWQVQTLSQDGRIGTTFIFDNGSFVLDPEPAATGSIPSPLNSPSGRRFPTLRWTDVAGAQRYEVWAKPVASLAYTLLGEDLEYPATESLDGTFLDPGDYTWFVKAFGTGGGLISSSASSPGTFTINPLEVIPDEQHFAALSGTLLPDNPEDADSDLDADDCRTQILNAVNQSECDNLRNTPVLRWAAKPNVGYYLLYVAKDKAMTNPVYDTNNDGVFTPITVNQPMWTPPAALPDSQAETAYYYKVVPCSYNRCEALTSAQHSFDKRSRGVTLKPVMHTPGGSATPEVCPTPGPRQECQNDVILSWDDFRTTEKSADPDTSLSSPGRTEARSYVVQTATDSSFNNLIETVEVDQTTFTSYETTYPEGTVFWRVQAVDGSANKLEWSATGEFDKKSPAPVLESPASPPNVTGDIYFTWASLPFAAKYRAEVYKAHDTTASPANLVVGPFTVGSRAFSLTNRLSQSPDAYVWRVRRLDAAGRLGAWSAWGEFTVVEPGTNLTSPVENASVAPSDGIFTWTAVTGAESYRFERRVAGTLTTVEPTTTRATSWAPQLAIAGGSWEWRVVPIDASGQNMTPSAWRPFTVVDTVVATTPVGISGSGKIGTSLAVDPVPGWNFGAAVTTTYQWYRGTSAITGEAGSTYQLTSADLGKSITVRATGARPGYISGTSTSNAITGIAGSAPVAVVDVSASGTGKVGTVLTLTPPTWDSDQVATTYRWRRDGVDISGSAGTGTTYTVTTNDVGKQLTVKATGTRAGYDPGSSVSSPIAGVVGDAPAASTDVAISGATNKVGQTWTVSAPTWNTTGVTTTYQWYRDATAITGANKTTYTLATADIGLSVTVRATGAKTGYAPGTSTSNAVVPEKPDTNTNLTPPSVTGKPAARETLTADPGTWPSGTTFTYQWFVNGLAVAGMNKQTYIVRTRDAGLPVFCRVTGSRTGYLPGEANTPSLTVAKLPTTTTARLVATPITKRARAQIEVTVDVIDLGVPLGLIQVMEGSKRLTRTQLKNDAGGEMTIRLKKLAPGKHKLVVSYLGSTATMASKAKKLKLVVLAK